MILLDVGVGFAAMLESHVHHSAALRLVDEAEERSLGVCRVTQLGWLRLLSNPVTAGSAVLSRIDAWEAVDAVLEDSRVVYLEEPPGTGERFRKLSAANDQSHKLWTDDYLAAFALTGGHAFATLDKKFEERYPALQVLTLPTGVA
ncbi:MAG: PIN domain-containing protein [Nocardioidaceae bacterium]|nr:MAG: PIN domain-containing protein [Nocardioidaceae bacterium]